MPDEASLHDALAAAQARIALLEQQLAAYESRVDMETTAAKSEYPPGLVIVLGGDLARWHAFEHSFRQLMTFLPPRSAYKPVIGQWLAAGINDALREALRPHHAWFSVFSDDHIFQPDIIYKLLRHDVDIVAPLVCLRSPPFYFSMFHDRDNQFFSFGFEELTGKTGLVEVESMGGPLVVIQRHVLDAIGHPFFEGEAGENPREDLVTYRKLHQAGYKLFIDTDCPIGHCGAGAVTPIRTADGRYGIRFDFQGKTIGTFFYTPTAEHTRELPVGYHTST